MNHTTPNLPADAVTAPQGARELNSDPENLHNTHEPLTTWIQNHEDMVRSPAERDRYSAEEIHQLAAQGQITAYPEGGTPDHPRRVLYSLSELRQAVGHTSRLPKVDEGQVEETPEPQLADLQLAQHRTGVTVHDLIAGIRRGVLTDHSQPKVMVQDGKTVYVPTEPLLDVDEVNRKRGELVP